MLVAANVLGVLYKHFAHKRKREHMHNKEKFLTHKIELINSSHLQIRFISSPSKLQFIISSVNIIDYIATLSFL